MSTSLLSPRVEMKPLVGLCRRMATSLGAGIDARTAWTREADRATGRLRRHLLTISEAVDRGESLTDGLAATDDYFPPIVREMIQVGEQTGTLERTFAQLADQYEARLTVRRTFLAAIAWPMIQLAIALGFIGIAIWGIGLVREMTGNKTFDIFGFGLAGSHGLATYLAFLAIVAAAIWIFIRAGNRGLMWTRPIQRFILRIPALGRPLQTIALERLAWSLHLTMNTGMNVRKALNLSLRSSQNARYIDHIPTIDAEIVAGNSIHGAFVRAGGYPADFLDTLAVGEQTGQISESMERLAKQYREQARLAISALAVLAGVAVYALVAAFIVVLIFRGALFYRNTLMEFMPK
jgi:type IV pilus assembly protein PilC